MQQLSRTQQGFSLISLMLGATLSLLSIIAMMTLYKNLVTNAIVATEDAQQDGQIASARLTLQRAIQAAGYGIENAVTGDSGALELRSGAKLSSGSLTTGSHVTIPGTTKGNLLLWRYQEGSAIYCRGVLSDNIRDEDDDDDVPGGVYELSVAGSACTGALIAQTWIVRPLVSPSQDLGALARGAGDDPTRDAAIVDLAPFQVNKASCWPYGQNADSTLTGKGFLQLAYDSAVTLGQSTKTTVCLTNFSVTM